MPQLDIHNTLTISQVVWMFILFGLLYLLVSRWGLPLVAEVVDARAARIAADLETAHAARGEANAFVADMTKAIHEAHAEAQARIAAALADAKAEAAAQAREMNERLDAQLAAAEGRITEARNAALGALRQVAAETTQVVVTRLTGQAADQAQVDTAVDRVLAARGRAA